MANNKDDYFVFLLVIPTSEIKVNSKIIYYIALHLRSYSYTILLTI